MLEFARCNAEKIHGLCGVGILPVVPRASRPRQVRAGRARSLPRALPSAGAGGTPARQPAGRRRYSKPGRRFRDQNERT